MSALYYLLAGIPLYFIAGILFVRYSRISDALLAYTWSFPDFQQGLLIIVTILLWPLAVCYLIVAFVLSSLPSKEE